MNRLAWKWRTRKEFPFSLSSQEAQCGSGKASGENPLKDVAGIPPSFGAELCKTAAFQEGKGRGLWEAASSHKPPAHRSGWQQLLKRTRSSWVAWESGLPADDFG